jgi:DNA-binding winged helix-turn-helix (wHTH) protein/tetratricopeptide (TPR) repeat protein
MLAADPGVTSGGNRAGLDCSPVVLAREQPFTIGAAEFRPATREVIFSGESCIIEPRVMQLLVALRRADGRIVSKIDLTDLCWGGRFVGDDAIHRVVSRLRTVAEKQAGGQFEVETITKVGYRLVNHHKERLPSANWLRIRRREMLIGGCALTLGYAGLTFFERDRGKLPPEVQKLIDDGHAAYDQGTVDQFAAAAAIFRQAAQIAPNRAEPWGGLAMAYQRQAASAPSPDDQGLHTRADSARGRAVAIDPYNGDALAAGVMAIPVFGNWLACERVCRAGLQRQPRHHVLNECLGLILYQVGRTAAALEFFDRAVAVDPNSVVARTLQVQMLYQLNRIDEAEEAGEAVYRTWPRHFLVWFSRMYNMATQGRPTEALAMIDDRTNRPIGIPDANFELTRLQVSAIQTRAKMDIDAAIKDSLDHARLGTGFAESAIGFAGLVGRVDDAYRVLDAYFFDRGFIVPHQRFALEQGTFTPRRNRATYMLFLRHMKPVRADPRFPALIAALGLDDYWKKSGTRPDYLRWS